MSIHLHHDDLPDGLTLGDAVAVDTETHGLNLQRDRLCLVQLSAGDGEAHLVRIEGPRPATGAYAAPNLVALLSDPNVLKLFHYARFDVAMLHRNLGVDVAPLYCTKIASKLVRTYTDRHGLKDLCRELLGVELSKQQQSSDWSAKALSKQQLEYAASDVLFLHDLKRRLDEMLARTERLDLAQACFEALPTIAALDLAGWEATEVFSH